MFKDYFQNLLEFSGDLHWYELDFVDYGIEELYRLSNLSDEERNSKNFSIIVILFNIMIIGVNTVYNDRKISRSGYVLIGGITLEILLTLICYRFRRNYYIFSRIKIIRYLLVYFQILVVISFPVKGFNLVWTLRSLYTLFLFVNLYCMYFMHFNFILLVLIGIFDVIVILFLQYFVFIDDPYLLFPELFGIFPLQYCIFLIKKSEIISKKKMFLKNYNNQIQIEYITKLVDVLNTMLVSIKNNEILYLNQYGIEFLEKFQNEMKGKRVSNNYMTEIKESELSIKKEMFNKILDHFFSNLILDQSHDLSYIDLDNPITLSQIIKEKMSSQNELSNIFIKIGLFSYHQNTNEQFFEVYIRKVKIINEVFELLIYDISSIKIAEKTKAETKYKQKILAKIAHEFKTPLITIITLIQSLNDHNLISILETSDKKKLSHVVNLSNYTIYLIQDIIQYVSEVSTLKITLSKIYLKEILDFCYDVLHTLVDCNENKSEKIKTYLQYDERINDINIYSDENKLKQILLNLISNSVKFTTCGYIKIKSVIDHLSNSIVISVEDTGLGIKEEDFHLIFKENIQLNVEKDYNNKGSGLGLAISKHLANSLNHKIKFESKYGKGTIFYLTIRSNNYSSKDDFELRFDSKSENIRDNNIYQLNISQELKSESKSEKTNRNANSLRLNISRGNKCVYESQQIDCRSSDSCSVIIIDTQQTIRKSFELIKILEFEDEMKEINQINQNELIIFNYNFSLFGCINSSSENYIVVVDDHKLVRINTINLIKLTLSSLNIDNFTIIEGSDGIDLLNIVRKDENCKIKCVFTDENMEYLNGSEAVKIIRKLEQNNKFKPQHIVTITAFDDNGTRNNILESGVNSILSKPCSKTAIKSILQKIIN